MDIPDSESQQDSGLYPMRLVTRLTGLSADTIRAWERRYSAIEPRRSAGNTRRFSVEDVRRLVLLRDATAQGHSISTIAKLDVDDLERLVGASSESQVVESGAPPSRVPPMRSGDTGSISPITTVSDAGFQELRTAYIEAIEQFDARRANETMMRAATFLDRRVLIFGMIVPLVQMVRIRTADATFGVAQEQMVSSHVRNLVSSVLRFMPPRQDASQILLTTPPGHRSELGALATALLAATKGLDPLYLGPGLPYEELKWAVHMSKAGVVILDVSQELSTDASREFSAGLNLISDGVEVWVNANETKLLSGQLPKARLFQGFDSLETALEGILRG